MASKQSFAARNLKATAAGGMRTGNVPSHNSVDGPVNGKSQGSASFSARNPVNGNLIHPAPSNVDPTAAKCAAIKAQAAAKQQAAQRRRNQRAAKRAATKAAQPAPVPPVHHFYACTATDWAVAPTREQAIAKVAAAAGAARIKRHVANNGGLYCWSVRVDLAQSAHYDIEEYKPVGVPLAASQECRITSARGKTAPYTK